MGREVEICTLCHLGYDLGCDLRGQAAAELRGAWVLSVEIVLCFLTQSPGQNKWSER